MRTPGPQDVIGDGEFVCRKRNGFTKFAPSGDKPFTEIVTSCRPGKACCNGGYLFGCVSFVSGLVKANPNELSRVGEKIWRSWMVEYRFAERSRVGQSGIAVVATSV